MSEKYYFGFNSLVIFPAQYDNIKKNGKCGET